MAEDVIAAAVASGERGVGLGGLSLHALPDSLYSLAGLQELDLSDNFAVPSECRRLFGAKRQRHPARLLPGIFAHLAEFTALKALNLRKNFLTGVLPDSLGSNAQLAELELDGEPPPRTLCCQGLHPLP